LTKLWLFAASVARIPANIGIRVHCR